MITAIAKRDGREVPFNLEKISTAILKALSAVGQGDEKLALELAAKVAGQIGRTNSAPHTTPSVEEIQDIVEEVLIASDLSQAAKAYILYRAERTRAREMNTRLMKTYEEIATRASKESNLKRDNANIDGDSAMGSMLKYGSEGVKIYNEMYVLKPAQAKAHQDGDIHIHDFDFYTLTTTCCQIDIEKLFKDGFSTGHGYLREPNDIASYSALACIAIQSNQNDQHGGQSIPNFDYGLADGVRKTFARKYRENLVRALAFSIGQSQTIDSQVRATAQKLRETRSLILTMSNSDEYINEEFSLLSPLYPDAELLKKSQAFAVRQAFEETDRATFQALEALIHNLNTMHSRAGAQVPFSSVNYGTDTSPEGRMVMKNIMLATEAGLGYGETPIFPIQIFKLKEGVNYNPGDPNYDLFQLACRCSAKRLFPNFSFIDAPFNAQYYQEGHPETEIAYMGCRTRVIGNVYDPDRQTVYGRGNLSFTSINLPRLALTSQTVDEFYQKLDGMIDLCIDQLLDRFEIQCRKKVRNFPFLMGDGIWLDSDKLGPDDEIREVLKHGTLTTGFIGLAECLKSLIGAHHGESAEAQKLGLAIITHMRRRMDEAAAKYKLNFSLIATPAEGLAGRFIDIDKKRFGIVPGVTDREYYTNSFHIPVYYPISAYDKIQREAPYHALTNGGHITYVELDGDPTHNLSAFESIIRCMKESGIGYGSINHPVDRDPICGYNGLIGNVCPKCGREEESGPKFERIRRITGYLVGTLDRFNNAKRAEVEDRVKHC